jgi:hypothetical protein
MPLTLMEHKKIWDRAEHNALTDLLRFKNKWFCCFRESDAHVFGSDGTIRILASVDGNDWSSIASLAVKGVDLRDPKLSITPWQSLMLLVGGSVYEGRHFVSRQPMVAFSENGESWLPFQKILFPHEWLWRVTWYQGTGYGVSYSFLEPEHQSKEWFVKLFSTTSGLDFDLITQWDISGKPNECTLRFDDNGVMVALLRKEARNERCAMIGHSLPPYAAWKWEKTSHHLGGPNFLILPDQEMIAAGRIEERNPYGYFEKTALLEMTLNDLTPRLFLPSGGVDCSYPGMVFYEGNLWVSYYSSHEGKTSIYLAIVGYTGKIAP